MTDKRKKNWLRLRSYLHFSKRFDSSQDKRKASKYFINNYVKNEDNICKHSFSPLLHYKVRESRFRRPYNDYHTAKIQYREYDKKDRPIYFCNHLDAQVFAFYANKLSDALEKEYEKDNFLNQSIIGYRRIPYNQNRGKSTIDFAKEVFKYIKDSVDTNIVVACLDIKSFFDNLSHKNLKTSWYNLTNPDKNTLKKDDYKVFKAITKAHFIDLEEILPLLPSFDIKNKNYIRKSKKDRLIYHFSELRQIISEHPYIIKKYNCTSPKIGIPQGTPISATLSNLYFLEADKKICNLIYPINGIYRRYSDDILIVCKREHWDSVYDALNNTIRDLALEINKKKNQITYFNRTNITSDWQIEYFQNGYKLEKNLSYLGFTFDGKNIKIKNSSLSKYYRSVKRLIRRSVHFAKQRKFFNEKNQASKDEWIYKRRIYKSKSYLGAKRRRTNVMYWGNFITYVKNVSNIMEDKTILKQVKNHWRIINDSIKMYEEKYDLKRQSTSPKNKSQ
ncbi:reverse transcriptase domain-containing protein [Emticicia fluvialis]|uniref:reverse transcriptase domain-containing protein n=1 Tax=Emticicia fluvialis TaxID=2974474 RepID=UPI0021655BB4|nr:reverse transcriptase domain-containing protein [Emticicia fluvialis]